MEINSSKNIVSNATIDAEGNVIVGDGNKIFNIKEAAQSQVLVKEIEDLDRQLAETRGRIEAYPEVPVFKQDLLKISEKRNEKQNDLDQLKKEILKLAEDFSRIPINTERLRLARQHFERGEFKEARAILNAKPMGQELEALLKEKDRLESKVGENQQQLQDKANEFLILARLTAVDFDLPDRYQKTTHYFEQSLQAWRTEENIFAFAHFLHEHNQFLQSLPFYQEALDLYRRLSLYNPERYEPDVASTQINLGAMYRDLNAYEKAEGAYREAMDIYQRLSQNNPERFEPYVAITQNNLGLMYSDLNAYEKAEIAYGEALEIRKRLSQNNPERYEPDVATTQNNLGLMYSALNAYEKAERAYQEALGIYYRLSQTNPERYEHYVAGTQNNLSLMYSALKAYEKAERACQEALDIYQRLSHTNPERYEPYVATTQNNLGLMHRNLKAYDKAERACQEALEIRKRLSQTNPERYEPDVSTTQNNLGIIYSEMKAYDKAERAYQEALEIRKRLSQTNPERYEPDLATTQTNLGLMYLRMGNGEQALIYLEQSLPLYQKLALQSPRVFDLEVARTLIFKTRILLAQGAQSAANDSLQAAKIIADKYPAAPFSATILEYFGKYYRAPNPS